MCGSVQIDVTGKPGIYAEECELLGGVRGDQHLEDETAEEPRQDAHGEKEVGFTPPISGSGLPTSSTPALLPYPPLDTSTRHSRLSRSDFMRGSKTAVTWGQCLCLPAGQLDPDERTKDDTWRHSKSGCVPRRHDSAWRGVLPRRPGACGLVASGSGAELRPARASGYFHKPSNRCPATLV